MLTEAFIRECAAAAGAPMCGFLEADPLEDCRQRLEERRSTRGTTSFDRNRPVKRTDFRSFYPEAETVVVIGVPYPFVRQEASAVAALCHGDDYHRRMTRIMDDMIRMMREDEPSLGARTSVDNPRLVDRWSGWRAGLGFFGRNNLLVSPQYGSFFTIGQILIDRKIDFAPVQRLEPMCGACRACLKACPTGALGDGYDLYPERCQSYLSQKKTLDEGDEANLKSAVLGCDLCQLCCPWNLKAARKLGGAAELPESDPTPGEASMMTDRQWRERFADTCAGWLGPEIVRRNGCILKNKKKR